MAIGTHERNAVAFLDRDVHVAHYRLRRLGMCEADVLGVQHCSREAHRLWIRERPAGDTIRSVDFGTRARTEMIASEVTMELWQRCVSWCIKALTTPGVAGATRASDARRAARRLLQRNPHSPREPRQAHLEAAALSILL